jgi:hypothetical protein
MTEHDRAEVLKYAEEHGTAKAAEHFGVSQGTIRSWRSRARSNGVEGARALQPGDDGYRLAERESRFGESGSWFGGESIADAIDRYVPQNGYEGLGVPRCVVESWQVRDRGEDAPVPAADAATRLAYSFASLPDDMRVALAGECERQAWSYHAPDMEHVRILNARKRAAQAAAEAERKAEREAHDRQRQADEEARAAEQERQAAQHVAKMKALEEEAERRREASEQARRQSEALRRQPVG